MTRKKSIRDNDRFLFEKIKQLPKKARTGKISDKIDDESTLTFARNGALKTFFVTNATETKQLTFLEAVEFLRCAPSEKRIPIGEKFFEQYDENQKEFKILLAENESYLIKSTRTPTNLKNVVATLKSLIHIPKFTDEQEEFIRRTINALNEGDIPAKDIQKISQLIKTETDPIQLFKKIRDVVDEKYLFGRQQTEKFSAPQRQVILSCSLKGR